MKRNAFAKINLYLSVTGTVPGGYHAIETVYQAISLSDTVTLEPTGSEPLRLFCTDPALNGENNLAFRAMQVFLTAVGAPQRGFSLTVEKRIPVSGGLAGGSTDAAATLLLLNSFFSEPLPRETLLRLALSLGADVPFCVLANAGEPAQIGTHLGEAMTPVRPLAPCTILVVPTGETVSTAEAYRESDRFPPDRENGTATLSEALECGDLSGTFEASYNRFEQITLPRCPEAGRLFRYLLATGADCVRMSGSGPTLLAFFAGPERRARAEAARERLGPSARSAVLCTPLPFAEGDIS